MSDLPAKHYLDIYRRRVSMAEKGISHPSPNILVAAKQLIIKLEAMDQEDRIKLDIVGNKAQFWNSATGELLVEMPNE